MDCILRPLTPGSRPNSLTTVRLPFELATTAHGIDATRVVMMMQCGGVCSILGVCSLVTHAEPSVRYGHACTTD